MHVAIPLFEGFDELDAIAPFEIFANAQQEGHAIEVALTTLDGAARVTASHGLVVETRRLLDDRKWDWIVVPGGRWQVPGLPGVRQEIEKGRLPKALRAHANRGTSMASVCTGAMLLSAAGLTRGRRAITHHVAKAALADEGAIVIDARVVDDGDLVTAGGVTSGIDLALHLLGRWFGEAAMRDGARRIEHEIVPAVLR